MLTVTIKRFSRWSTVRTLSVFNIPSSRSEECRVRKTSRFISRTVATIVSKPSGSGRVGRLVRVVRLRAMVTVFGFVSRGTATGTKATLPRRLRCRVILRPLILPSPGLEPTVP